MVYIFLFKKIVACKMQEGKLRVLQYDRAPDANISGANYFSAENMAEVEL